MMDKKEFYKIHAEFCKTLLNPKRQEIVDVLRDREMTVNELRENTNFTQSNLSQHLSVLRTKGIVNSRREGTNIYYRVSNQKIIRAYDLISEAIMEELALQNKTMRKAFGYKK